MPHWLALLGLVGSVLDRTSVEERFGGEGTG